MKSMIISELGIIYGSVHEHATGLDVIVSMGGKIKALYTFLDRAPR